MNPATAPKRHPMGLAWPICRAEVTILDTDERNMDNLRHPTIPGVSGPDAQVRAREQKVPRPKSLILVFAAHLAILAAAPNADAEDLLKIAVTQRGAWDSAVPELGQQAGIFKKHGLVLELSYAPDADGDGDGEIEPAVTSGQADVGLGIGIMGVLRAYGREVPLRIIGASTTGSAGYWYVPANSSIKAVKDIKGGTIAHPDSDVGRYDVFDFLKRYRVRARPVSAAGATATFNQVMAGRIDVGWATPPFGIDAIEHGQIRIIARANEVPKVRDRTARVMIATADTLAKRKDALVRFIRAYREAVELMYADPAVLARYAELAGMPEGLARRQRDEFYVKSMLLPNEIIGLDATVKDAVAVKILRSPLTRKQAAELIQIPQDAPPARSFGKGWLFSPGSR